VWTFLSHPIALGGNLRERALIVPVAGIDDHEREAEG
jgi:hypothetical protein